MNAVIGVLVGLFGIAGSPEVLAILPEYIALGIQGVGLILAAVSKSPLGKKEKKDAAEAGK